MRCLKCGYPMPDDSRFCQLCGAELHLDPCCSVCGAPLPPDAAFCSKCGNPTSPAEKAPAPKRKQGILLLGVISAAVVLLALLGVLLFNLLGKLSFPAPQPEPNAPQILSPADAAQSVLYLECYDSTGDMISSGSGFLIRDGKTLVTNYHVIENVYSIAVYDAQEHFVADVFRVLFSSEVSDLAVLELDRDSALLPLTLGNSDPVRQGDGIYAIGYPLGMSNTLSDGIVSSRFTQDTVEILQITAPISPGSSGGALLDENNTVIGIVYAQYVDGQNLNLAVAVNELSALMNRHSSPVGLDELYLESHPQLNYDSYEVGLKSIHFSDNQFAEEIYDLWLTLTPSAKELERLIHEYEDYSGFEYRSQTEYVSRGMYAEDFDSWCFDVDRNFGDVYWASEGEGSALYFFYEVKQTEQSVPEKAPANEVPETEIPAKEAPAAELPAEETQPPACVHIWSVWAVRKPEGCTGEGRMTACCSLCHTSEVRIIPANGHTVVIDTAEIPPTCTEAGTTQSAHCSVCGTVIASAASIPATGHSYTNGLCTICSTADPNYVSPLSEDFLQGTWHSSEIDGIYGRRQEYVFSGNQFYWTFWKGGMNEGGEDAIEAQKSGTYTIDGSNVYFSDGTVGTLIGDRLYISGLAFYKPY